MIMPRVLNMTGICAQMPTPGLSCSLEWLCFRNSPVWCKNPKNNEFRTKKFPNQEFLYGISSFCTLSENNSFLHGKISCFCIFLAKMAFIIQTELPEWSTEALRYEPCTQFINVSQRALHIYFIDGCRVCPLDAQYKVKNKNSDLWASSQSAVSVLTLHGS